MTDDEATTVAGALAEGVLAAEPHELGQAFRSVFERFGRTLGARAVSVWVIEASGADLPTEAVRIHSWSRDRVRTSVPLAGFRGESTALSLAADEIAVIRRDDLRPELAAELDRRLGYHLETGLTVPIVIGGDVRALFSVGWEQRVDVTAPMLDASRNLARAVERALQRERRLAESMRRSAVHELVAEVATLLLSVDPGRLDDVMPAVLDAVSGFFGGRIVGLAQVTDDRTSLRLCQVAGTPPTFPDLRGESGPHDAATAAFLAGRTAAVIERPDLVAGWRRRMDELLPAPVRSILLAPLTVADAVAGCLLVFDTGGDPWIDDAAAVVQHAADLVSFALLRRRDAEALALERERAERADRAKTEFLSRASHELRTPLQAVLGYAQLLAADAPGPRQRELLHRIERAGDHLVRLIDDVLDLGRLEADTVDVTLVPTDPVRVSDEALAVVGELARRRGVSAGVVLEELPAVLADPMRLRQVLVNLLSNGIRYNRRGGRVDIEGRRLPGRVALDVVDTGDGIDPSKLDRLFVPFDRLDRSGPGAGEGAGLGLPLARRLVEAMHGELLVESAPGVGSRFSVVLAATDDPVVPPVTRDTVLCFSRHPSDLELLMEVLGSLPGLDLRPVTSAAGLREVVDREQPAIVVIGSGSGTDGSGVPIELVEAVRRAGPPPPDVVVVLPAADLDAERVLTGAGAAVVLSQPLDVASLLSRIGAVLTQRDPALPAG